MKRLQLSCAFFMLCTVIGSLVTGISSAQVSAQFSAFPKSGCEPLFVTFNNTSTGTGVLTYTWNFGNGNTSNLKSPSQTYNACGNYVVTLTVGNGTTTSTDTAHVTVYCKPAINFTYSTSNGCPGTCVTFTNNSTAGSGTISSTFWDFGDGNTSPADNPTHCYMSPGNFNVTLTIVNSFGCTNSTVITNAITIYKTPIANFSGSPTSFCSIPATVNFKNSSIGLNLSYNWDFGDPSSGTLDTSSFANPSHTYNSFGNYVVTLITTNANGCSDTLTLPNYIAVGSFTANITTSSSTTGCCPFIVNFSEVTTGTPIGYNWVFGGGIANSAKQSPQITFPCPAGNTDTFNVTLTETFTGGCTATATTAIIVNNTPTANFTSASTLSTCILPDIVTFNNTSTGAAGTTYLWSFGDGDTSSAVNPTHSYTTCGSYNVTLTATNLLGCSNSITQKSFVNLTCPAAAFTATPTGGCVPQAVSFNSTTSTGTPISWNWNFGDPGSGAANTSVLQNPVHIYTQPGCYNVSLVITNAQGCMDSITTINAVCVNTPPVPGFSATPLVACAHIPIVFTNLSTDTDSLSTFHWSFGDNTTSTAENPSHIYNDTGYLSVTLTACNSGCCVTLTINNYIYILPPIAIIKDSLNCKDAFNVCFDGSTSIGANSYEWNFDDPASGALDSSNVVATCHTFSDTGNYLISLTVFNDSTGCSFTQTSKVHVVKVQAAFTTILPSSGCSALNVSTVNNSINAISYSWTITDSTTNTILFTSKLAAPTFTFATSGKYVFQLVVIDSGGCTDTAISIVDLNTFSINASFILTPNTGCAPLNVQFTDNSTSTGGPITKWSWDFDDPASGVNNMSTLQNPSHIYKLPGCYKVGLIVTDSLGCSSTTYILNAVCVYTVATNFNSVDSISCAGIPICFTALAGDTINSYDWNFGDTASGVNDSSNLMNPCHVYNASGIYSVTLKVTTPNGCDSILIKSNFITIIKPTANFRAGGITSSICPPLLVNFIDSSYSNIVSWQWDFGDGNTSTNQNPSHVYSISGSYTVTLIVTNSNGCTDTLIRPNYVVVQGPNGTFIFTPDIGCSPLNVCFKASTSTTTNLTYIWNYGNTTSGPLFNGDSICYTYTLPGIYHPSLILLDSAGCVFSVNSPDSVWVRVPKTKFVMDDNPKCGSGTVQFTDSTSSISKITLWSWDFGDPSSGTADTSTLQNPTHNYTIAGKYNITLTVTTLDGCVNTYEDTLTVFPTIIPIIETLNNPTCINGVISFKDSTLSTFKLVSWLWNFGDTISGVLDTSTQQNTSHQYNSPGKYTVKLIIADIMGCKDSITKMVTVNPLPNANAGPNQKICLGSSATLNASGGLTYSWTPSTTLSNSAIYNPIANPTTVTTYTVLVTDSNGCKNTDSVIVAINPLPVDSISSAQKICYDLSTNLFAKGGISYSWSPAAGLSNSTISNPVASPINSTTYIVTVTDANSCKSNDSVVVKVNPLPPANAGPKQSICIGNSTTLIGSGGITYSWSSLPIGFSSTLPSPTINPTITTQYILNVTDTNGCIANDTTKIFVNPLPVVALNSNVAICIGSSTTLDAGGGINYLWSPTTGLSNININNPIAAPKATTIYSVLVTDSNGCKNTDSVIITVNPLPVDSVSPTQKICYGLSTTLFAKGGIIYSWSPTQGLSDSTINNPIANPTTATTYTVIVTDINGCQASDSVVIKVNPLPPANAGPNQTICIGKSATLNGSGGINYTWSSNPLGFSSVIPSPTVAPTITTQYIVDVTDTNSCIAGDTTTVFVHLPPLVTVSSNVLICLGSSIQLLASGGSNYLWSPFKGLNNPNIFDPVATPTDTATYFVTVTDSLGCSSIDSVKLDVILPFKAIFGAGDTICAGSSAQLNASGGVVYKWSPANSLNNAAISNPVASPTTSTLYTVLISDSVCFTDTGNVFVDVYSNPSFYAGTDQTILDGQSVVLGQTTPAFSGIFNWTPSTGLSCDNCQNPIAKPDSTTTYIVTLTNQFDCITTDTVTITIKILCAEDVLFVPDAFTPNNDGLNDIFYVRTKGIRQLNYFRVFDRWGELLFETNDSHIGWDGTYKGKKLPPAVYIYDVSAICSSGETISKKGNVTLIR